jgi:hypothetical protein
MATLALALVLGHAAIYGVAREPDEGAAAHIFQLLVVAQIPVAIYFVLRWVRASPKQFFSALALLAGLWVSAFVGVALLT